MAGQIVPKLTQSLLSQIRALARGKTRDPSSESSGKWTCMHSFEKFTLSFLSPAFDERSNSKQERFFIPVHQRSIMKSTACKIPKIIADYS